MVFIFDTLTEHESYSYKYMTLYRNFHLCWSNVQDTTSFSRILNIPCTKQADLIFKVFVLKFAKVDFFVQTESVLADLCLAFNILL